MRMTKNSNKLISFLLIGLFALSFVMPTLQGPMGVKFDGISVALLNIGSIKFVSSLQDYLIFLFLSLTNIWVIVMIFWSFRTEIKIIPTFILGILSISSALYWMVQMEDRSVLLNGYWLWLLSIVLISTFNLFKAFSKPKMV